MLRAAVRNDPPLAQGPSDETCWAAVLARDPRADGRFYYSVSTTRVYCRPSCPSRQARREHVRFHLTPADAERAGFRPCKRCRPTEQGVFEQHAAAVSAACRLIETAEQAPSLARLAKAAGMSRFHFHRTFKAVTGITPRAYAVAHRANRLRSALSNRGTVTEAIYEAGFGSSGRFYAASAGLLGMAPKAFLSGGAGAAIRFAVARCSLGAVLVAATAKGICAILLGDDAAVLVADLRKRFSNADIAGGDEAFEGLVATVIRLVEQPSLPVGLPLDIRGTAFQQRVWQALREVPAGTTTSYTALARRIGAPKAVRAVAQACASNSLAVAIPCHRAVRLDGGLSGYRWGIERKRTLLERESAGPARTAEARGGSPPR